MSENEQNILIIASRKKIQLKLRQALNRLSNDINHHIIEDSGSALDKLDKIRYDCIIFNREENNYNTFGLLEKILDKPEAPPLILLVGVGKEEVGKEAIKKGAQEYLIKDHFDSYLLNRAVKYAQQRNELIQEKNKLINELQEALERVKTLEGLVPICSKCNKIRDDGGYWHKVEKYIAEHSEAQFSHGLCPSCYEEEKEKLEDE